MISIRIHKNNKNIINGYLIDCYWKNLFKVWKTQWGAKCIFIPHISAKISYFLLQDSSSMSIASSVEPQKVQLPILNITPCLQYCVGTGGCMRGEAEKLHKCLFSDGTHVQLECFLMDEMASVGCRVCDVGCERQKAKQKYSFRKRNSWKQDLYDLQSNWRLPLPTHKRTKPEAHVENARRNCKLLPETCYVWALKF